MNSRRSHSITSSASASTLGGSSRPSAFAVLRLMTRVELGRLQDRQVGRLVALENSASVDTSLAIRIRKTGAVAD